MNCAVDVMNTFNGMPYFGSALVAERELQNNTVNVNMQLMGKQKIVAAKIAVQYATPLDVEDEVLVAGASVDAMFVIGIIKQYGSACIDNELRTSSGAYVTVKSNNKTHGEDTIIVYSPRNELLFEYNPSTEKAKINIEKGDLEFKTTNGNISLIASQAVKIKGETIDLTSKKLNAKVTYAKLLFDRLETVADTLVERAKNVYRIVTQLTQLRTGRMRTFVDETYQFKANKAFLKSEEDFKIKGEKIHLG